MKLNTGKDVNWLRIIPIGLGSIPVISIANILFKNWKTGEEKA